MKFFTICCCLLITAGSYAQVSGHVTGIAGKPVQFATATLISSADSTIISSVAVNDTGNFSIGGVQPGKYFVRISAVGYQLYSSPVFDVRPGQAAELSQLVMKEINTDLGEVVVRADKPPVQQTAEGVTVNVQNSLMSKGSSVMDVLQRSPGVIFDQHNNALSLNGKAGVRVMIDGRLMRMGMDQLIIILSSMSADNIDKIELMNTPPAKYDAEGNAGIINIITRKNKKRGTNGSATITAGYGMYEKASAGFTINHNTRKLNLYGSYSYWHDHNYGGLYAAGSTDVPIIGDQNHFNYSGISRPLSNYQDAAFSADIKPDTATTIGASLSYWGGGSTNRPHNYGYYLFERAPSLHYNSYFDNSGHVDNALTNMYLDKDLAGGQKIRADLDYLYYKTRSLASSQSTFMDDQGNQASTADSLYSPLQRGFGNTVIKVLVGKLDYSKQLGKKMKLEAGAKLAHSRTIARSGIEDLENNIWIPNIVGSANNFTTYESIGAGYLTINVQPDSNTSLVAGARYEYSHNYTDKSADTNYSVNRKLGRIFPSVFFSRKLDEHSSWQVSYTERITRPSFNDLASYVGYNDPVSVFTGNPLLKPTVTRNLKFGYNDRGYLFSLLFSRDDDPIFGTQQMPGPVKGVVYLRPENGDWQNAITLQATIPVKVNSWWDMNYTFTGGVKQYRISFTPHPLEKTFMDGSFNYTENFKFRRGLSAELSGYCNLPSYSANWHSYGNTVINLGVKKQFASSSLKISVADVFRGGSYKGDVGQLTEDAFKTNVHVIYNSESRLGTIVKLTYYHSFGSTGVKNRQKRDSGSNDERGRLAL